MPRGKLLHSCRWQNDVGVLFHGVLEPSWMLEQLASALAFWPAGMSSGPFAHGFSLLPRKGF